MLTRVYIKYTYCFNINPKSFSFGFFWFFCDTRNKRGLTRNRNMKPSEGQENANQENINKGKMYVGNIYNLVTR